MGSVQTKANVRVASQIKYQQQLPNDFECRVYSDISIDTATERKTATKPMIIYEVKCFQVTKIHRASALSSAALLWGRSMCGPTVLVACVWRTHPRCEKFPGPLKHLIRM